MFLVNLVKTGGGLTASIRQYEISLSGRKVRVLYALQSEMAMELRVETGSQVNLYGSTYSLRILADMVDTVSNGGGIAFLERHNPEAPTLPFSVGPTHPWISTLTAGSADL
jgi:hypothetical protein